MPDDFIKDVKANYNQVWDDVRGSVVAFGFPESAVEAMSVSEEERQRVFEEAWQKGGGFRYMFGTFCDIATDREANEEAAKFVRAKIAGIVKDPATADALTPTDLYAKRPLCDAGYFETYNLDNVELVDVKKSPIEEITPKGIRTADNEYELDILVFATGFDAVSGNFVRIDIRGKDGEHLKDKWATGPTSYLGMTNSGYPNMFMVLGPNGPFTNQPPAIEAQVEWITDAIKYANDKNVAAIEATPEAEAEWTETCNEIANMTLFPEAESWIFGANIPGKPNVVMFYMAGLGAYRQVCNEAAENDYAGFSKVS